VAWKSRDRPLRAGASDAELSAIFIEEARLKPMAHGLIAGGQKVDTRMSFIGGVKTPTGRYNGCPMGTPHPKRPPNA